MQFQVWVDWESQPGLAEEVLDYLDEFLCREISLSIQTYWLAFTS